MSVEPRILEVKRQELATDHRSKGRLDIIPLHVTCLSVHRRCGKSMQAFTNPWRGLRTEIIWSIIVPKIIYSHVTSCNPGEHPTEPDQLRQPLLLSSSQGNRSDKPPHIGGRCPICILPPKDPNNITRCNTCQNNLHLNYLVG